jgi:hypothetical protein
MKRTLASWLLPFSMAFLGFAGNGLAANEPCTITNPVPCKILRIFNNNPVGGANIYVFFESFIQDPKKADLWMQAYFNIGAAPKVTDWVKVGDHYESSRRFATTRLRRGYIQVGNDVSGNGEGIAPGTSVDIVIPFYTQLLTTTDANLGQIPDQYIDWWNSGRIYFFDTPAGFHSAKVTNANNAETPGGQLPPPPVKVLDGAAVPSCISSTGKKCSVPLFENAIEPIPNIPFQLQEYTLASAEGPPENNSLPPPGRTAIQLDFVNYNVSSLDSVFLPVAMGPLTKAGDSVDHGVTPSTPTPYVGTALPTVQFRQTLDKFSSDGNNWPFYVPAYFDDKDHAGFPGSPAKACSLAPFPTDTTGVYNLPKLPGAYNVITASYLGARVDDAGQTVFPPVPPTLSSNPANYKSKYTTNACTLPTPPPFVNPPKLGVAGKSTVDLWNRCYPSTSDQSETCEDIRTVAKLFVDGSYFGNTACTNPQTPPFYIVMQGVYGWVPIVNRGCTGLDLKKTNLGTGGYEDAAQAYCRLQYNYTMKGLPEADIFNPYTALIHAPYSPVLGGGLDSSAYAFSIDDKLSFKHVVAEGIILAIAGTKGVEFDKAAGQTAPVPTPIPVTPEEIKEHCKLD